ncbi:hypothetical protein ECE50_004960 [Chitinophaga sp. Mgbs1]|uniref:Uncharacterized protein n=1 Tax=Chitinophaga solisilvae TaxID=1233460 RepID=A0A433WE15_9BACT|nr:hypothetical protein [Chitinophaga solisilvae]
MKNNFLLKLLICLFFLVSSCTKEEYRAPSISGVGKDTIVLNIGDKTVLAPSISNLKGNSYTWLVNGKETASGQINYTFDATEPGNFEVTFKVNNKGGADQQSFRILVEKPVVVSISELPAVAMCRVVEITPAVTGPERTDYEYEWSVGDSVIGKTKNLNFISPQAGTFALNLRVSTGRQTATVSRTITVKPEKYTGNAYILLEYAPAPGKNHNWSIIGDPEFWDLGQEYPLAYNDFLARASDIRRTDFYSGLVLGSWGGSATFKFDHTVANAIGKPDLELTATCSRLDLPAVYVAYDRNKNGKPDEDEWYEIKNDDYGIEDMPDYAMTFTYNKTATDDIGIKSSFNWKDNQSTPVQGEILTSKAFSGSMTEAGTLSTRGLFPGLAMIDVSAKKVVLLDGWNHSFTRKGKRITRNLTGAVAFSQKLNIDIDKAVNNKGETVLLPGIDFVKIKKVVYPFQQDFINAGGKLMDFNMEEERMLQVAAILDKHLKN